MADGGESLREDPRVALQQTTQRELANEWALVLISQGMSPQVRQVDGMWVLVVPLDEAGPAAATLAAYLNENPQAQEPEAGSGPSAFDAGYEGTNAALLYAGSLIAFFMLTGSREPEVWWFAQGSADAQRILDGELWRNVTALTLHADLTHVLSNAVMGALLIGALSGLLGSGLAFALVLASGIAGNFANALLQSASHVSVGASTAVFGALGVLGAVSAAKRHHRGAGGRRIWLPFAAGLGILAMLGVGGERVDVWAHLLGFGAGALIGGAQMLYAGPTGRVPPPAAQRQLIAFGLIVIVGSWVIALP